MAVSLPEPLRRRGILYGPTTPKATLIEYGQAYEEAGMFDNALQFFAQAVDRDGLSRMRTKALDLGDAFMLKAVARAIPDLVNEDDWRTLIDRAEKLGKELFAAQGRAAIEGQLGAIEPEEKQGQGKA